MASDLSRRDMRGATPVPLMVLTGFLGSGKTTLLNAILRHRGMTGTAVLVNEVGSVGIDHDLVVGASDDILLLEGGCLCCQPKGSVADGVSRLLRMDSPPRRIIIETSGAANPFPILELLSQHPLARTGYQFPRVTTVVDTLHGETTLAQHPEARWQIAAADCIVVTKSDMTDAAQQAAIDRAVQALNPAAARCRANPPELPNGFLEVLQNSHAPTRLRAGPPDVNRHGSHGGNEFLTVALQFDGRLPAARVQGWLDHVLDLYGGNVLRIKGILDLVEYDRPAVLQCVRDIVHPIELLAPPATSNGNSIVVIGWDMHPELLREALDWLADEADSTAAIDR